MAKVGWTCPPHGDAPGNIVTSYLLLCQRHGRDLVGWQTSLAFLLLRCAFHSVFKESPLYYLLKDLFSDCSLFLVSIRDNFPVSDILKICTELKTNGNCVAFCLIPSHFEIMVNA